MSSNVPLYPEEKNPYFKTQAERDRLEAMMEERFQFEKGLGLTNAITKEEFYGFDVCQIWKIHHHKQGYGSGLFFRLISGLVVDAIGRSHGFDETLYDQTTH
jgi:hypothetical protein